MELNLAQGSNAVTGSNGIDGENQRADAPAAASGVPDAQ